MGSSWRRKSRHWWSFWWNLFAWSWWAANAWGTVHILRGTRYFSAWEKRAILLPWRLSRGLGRTLHAWALTSWKRLLLLWPPWGEDKHRSSRNLYLLGKEEKFVLLKYFSLYQCNFAMASCDFAMMYLRRLCDGHMQDFVTTLWSALHDLTYFLIKKWNF